MHDGVVLLLVLSVGCRGTSVSFPLLGLWAQGSHMTGLIALEAFTDRYALPVQVSVLQLQILDVPEGRPVFWSVRTLVGQQMPEIYVI